LYHFAASNISLLTFVPLRYINPRVAWASTSPRLAKFSIADGAIIISLSEFIVTAHTARASGSHDNNFGTPAMANMPYNSSGEQGAGVGGRGNSGTWEESNQASNGKAIITLANPIFNNPTFSFPTHTSPENQDGWTQSY
jgi:hypothetical protein